MKKKILQLLGLGIFFIGKSVFAQQCPQPLNNLDIQINMNPLQYEYGYTSVQMESIRGNANPNLLGLFSGAKSINIQPSFKLVPLSSNYYCMIVSSALIK